MSGKELSPSKSKTSKKPSRPKPPTRLQKFCLWYEKSLLLPYIVGLLNHVGAGGVDRLIAKVATDFELKQLGCLIEEVEKKVDRSIREPMTDDFMAAVHISVAAMKETATTDKAKHFASVLAGTWSSSQSNWSEVSQTLKLIRELEETHIRLLKIAFELPVYPNGNVATFCVNGNSKGSVRIEPYLPDVDPRLIGLCISDLISKGLINDTFSGFDGGSLDDAHVPGLKPTPLIYMISDLGRWFIERLMEPELEAATPA